MRKNLFLSESTMKVRMIFRSLSVRIFSKYVRKNSAYTCRRMKSFLSVSYEFLYREREIPFLTISFKVRFLPIPPEVFVPCCR